jgi:hypothetical protein
MAEHGAGLSRTWLATEIIVPDLHGGQSEAIGALDIDDSPTGQNILRRRDSGLFDFVQQLWRFRRG